MINLKLKEKLNTKNGITLVALIVSIIVLLILATVSINLVINNGILDKAKTAVDKYSEGEICEQIKLAYLEYQQGRFLDSNLALENSMKASLESIFNDTITVEKQGTSIKVKFANAKKSYKYYSNGTVKEVMDVTSVYAKLDGDTLKLRATNPGNYKLYSNSGSIQSNWNEENTASRSSVKYIEIEEPIAPNGINFSSLSNLESITNIEYLHTENMTSFGEMFARCTSLIELNLSNFDTCNVNYMAYMFQFDGSLTSIKLNNFDTSSVTNMTQMFYNCSKLTELDLSSFDTSNVTSMGAMFYNCNKLNNLNLGRKFIIKNISIAEGMFNSANSSIKINAIEDTKEKIKQIRTSYTDSNFE